MSDLSSIIIDSDHEFRFYVTQVKWDILINNYEQPRNFVADLEQKISSMDYVETHYDEVVSLCEDLSLRECLFYLGHALEEHSLPFKPGEKTRLVLLTALKTFSVSQIYSFIWRAVKDAASFHMRKNVARHHAANTVVGNISSQTEKAIANNWTVSSYRRNYDYPQPTVRKILYNNLLHTDDGGFNQPLNKVI